MGKSKNALAQYITAEVNRQLKNRTITAIQSAKDAAIIAANETLGLGEGRVLQFSEAFDRNVQDIAQTTIEDTRDIEYTKDYVDRQLRPICGKHFVPWEERYI